jgi:hypothetical protein
MRLEGNFDAQIGLSIPTHAGARVLLIGLSMSFCKDVER